MLASQFVHRGRLPFLAAAILLCSTVSVRGDDATHAESKDVVIKGDKGETLQTFCLGTDGRIFALLAKPVQYGAERQSQSTGGGEVHVFDADGKQLSKWTLDFAPQRIAASPSGDIVVGGSGQLARFNAEGKLLGGSESPHLATVLGDKDALRTAAEEQHRSNIDSYVEQLKQFEEQAKELEAAIEKQEADKPKKGVKADAADSGDKKAKPTGEVKQATTDSFSIFSLFTVETTTETAAGSDAPPFGDGKQQQLKMIRQMADSYRRMLDSEKKRTVEDVMAEITARLQKIHGIAVGKNDVFVATAVAKGYGYAVWRMTADFKDAKQIVNGLSGCCGQIDVQCRDDKLFVAENSRHRVVSFDREGKRIDAWGKRDRDGEGGGFGGCCNPMNLCFLKDGEVVTSESEGLVKRFSPAGEFLGLIGKAKVSGGCKNVAVAASPDGKRIYFYDLQGSKIIILSQRETAKPNSTAATTNSGEE